MLKSTFLEDRRSLVENARLARSKHHNALNIHLPRTLDESYYIGLSNSQLVDRNVDQVISRLEKNAEKQRLLMVSQLWLWKMDDIVVSACGSERKWVRYWESERDPQTFLLDEFKDGSLYADQNFNSLQLTILIFSECINFLDRPNCAALEEPVFYIFERAIATLYDEVQSYMDQRAIEKIQIKQEQDFFHQISDIRDELAMIKSIIIEQGEVWDLLYKDLRNEMSSWDENIRRIATRPESQIPRFKRRIEKIDDDAQRVERWIQVQLDLKKTHASLRESHNSTVLSTAVIGFTIVTVVFTPLSFMTSLLAVPDDKFKWKAEGKTYMGKTFMSKSPRLCMYRR